MKEYTDAEKVLLLVTLLVSMRDSCRGSGLDRTIDKTLNEVAPRETAIAEMHGFGNNVPPMVC